MANFSVVFLLVTALIVSSFGQFPFGYAPYPIQSSLFNRKGFAGWGTRNYDLYKGVVPMWLPSAYVPLNSGAGTYPTLARRYLPNGVVYPYLEPVSFRNQQ